MSSTVIERRLIASATAERTSAVAGARRVFLCLSSDWNGHPSTLTHIFKIISKTEPVIWVNSIGQRAPRLCRRDMQRLVQKLMQRFRVRTVPAVAAATAPNVVIEPRVLPFHGNAAVRTLNRYLLSHQIEPHLAPWREQGAEIVVVTTNPIAAYLADTFGATRTIYFCMDEYAEMPECDRDTMRLFEPQLLTRADSVFATSRVLARTKSNGKNPTVYLPQGVDFEHFQTSDPLPPALADLPRPIIGFQGIVGARVDLDLFEKVLRRFPQATLVTVGRSELDLSRLRRYPNYRHFAAVPYAELPRWVRAFDIGLIAYKQDGHTAAVNPLKLFEYLATGVPVVSLELPELKQHAAFVALTQDHDSYLNALATLIARFPFDATERERRRTYAREHSWRQRAEQFLTQCERLSAEAGI